MATPSQVNHLGHFSITMSGKPLEHFSITMLGKLFGAFQYH